MRSIVFKTTWVILLSIVTFGMVYSALPTDLVPSDSKFLSRLGKKQTNLLQMAQSKDDFLSHFLANGDF
ncbi:MAG: hypothetical protein ABH844_04980 [Candidatus Omnitrophota bacterium]